MLHEHEYNIYSSDKIFSSQWLTTDTILLGTKCNQLILLHVSTGRKTLIPTIQHQQRHQHQSTVQPPIQNQSQRHGGVHALKINPSHTLLAATTTHPAQIGIYHLPSFKPLAILDGHADWVFGVEWVSDTRLVSISRDHTVAMWDLSLLFDHMGHLDDGSSMGDEDEVDEVDHTQPEPPLITLNPIKHIKAHDEKVRALCLDARYGHLYTLSSDTTVKLWDVHSLEHLRTAQLVHANETVCMTQCRQHELIAIGSQSHVSFLDLFRIRSGLQIRPVRDAAPTTKSDRYETRSTLTDSDDGPSWLLPGSSRPLPTRTSSKSISDKSILHTRMRSQAGLMGETPDRCMVGSVPSLDDRLGVRSLLCHGDLVTVGGGSGRVSFFDLRMHSFMDLSTQLSYSGPDITAKSFGLNGVGSGSGPYQRFALNYFNSHDEDDPTALESAFAPSPTSPLGTGHPTHTPKLYLSTGQGYLMHDQTYLDHFNGVTIPNAVYTLQYDPWTHTRLFVGGGPLQLGLRGHYCAVWE